MNNNQPSNPLGFDNIYGDQPLQNAPMQPQTQSQFPMQPQFNATQMPGQPLNDSPKKKSGKIIGIIAGASAALIALIVIVVIMLGNNNPIAGTWSCTKYSDYFNYGEPTTKLKLEKNKSYQYGQYSDIANNHFAGKSYEVEKLNKNATDGTHYHVTFSPVTEYIVDGEKQDPSKSSMDSLEFVLLNEKKDGKPSAFITFEHSYNMYTCVAE